RYVWSKLGVDPIGADDELRIDRCSVRERYAGAVCVLLKVRAPVSGVHDAGGQGGSQEFDKVSAMHSECGIPAGGVRHLHRRDRSSVGAEVSGVRAYSG